MLIESLYPKVTHEWCEISNQVLISHDVTVNSMQPKTGHWWQVIDDIQDWSEGNRKSLRVSTWKISWSHFSRSRKLSIKMWFRLSWWLLPNHFKNLLPYYTRRFCEDWTNSRVRFPELMLKLILFGRKSVSLSKLEGAGGDAVQHW